MKLPIKDHNFISSFILILASGVLLLIVTFTDRRDLTTASVVISAMVLFLTGIFLLTFTKKESIDGRISALLPTQNSVTICRVASDLGINGDAVFLPPEKTDQQKVMQFIPVSSYNGGVLEGDSFPSGSGEAGLLIPPAGEILFSELKTRNNLIIPETLPEMVILIREVGEDILEISEKMQVTQTGEGISVIMHDYLLADGCNRIAEESPSCCKKNPCPICSLFAMVLAYGSNRVIQVERCRSDKKSGNVEILFSMVVPNPE